MDRIIEGLYKPKDGSSLAVIRILFGILMMVDIVQERGGSRIETIWGNKMGCHFPLFPFLKPLDLEYMCTIYAIMWLCALFVALGLHFKLSAFLFSVSYWILVLLDKSYWNNHTYLYGLLAILLAHSSAHHCWSVDAVSNRYSTLVPNWNYFLLRFQLFILYFYAGLKKVDLEWLCGHSMRNLGEHWIFDIFRYFLTFEQVDYFVIHLSGFLIDISSGFLLIFSQTRPLALLINVCFHAMNTRLFNIGMFPYVCLATLPIFCEENWPRKLISALRRNTLKQNSDAQAKMYKSKRRTTVLVVLYCIIQLFLPWSHFITKVNGTTRSYLLPRSSMICTNKGYNNWTPGLYGYSWDMMVHRWDTALTVVKVVDRNTNEEFHLDPNAWTMNERWSKHADMCVQYAGCVKRNIITEEFQQATHFKTSSNISIFIDVWCSLNGRFQQRMFDPNYDLLAASWSPFNDVQWLQPLLTDYNDWRARIAHIEHDVHGWSNDSDVMVIADFPGLTFDNYISSGLTNVSLTVLEGAVYYQTAAVDDDDDDDDDDRTGWYLQEGNVKDIPTDSFHKITTVSATPSCIMYTYFNRTKAVTEHILPSTKDHSSSPIPILENGNELFRDFQNFVGSVYKHVIQAAFNKYYPF